MEIFQTYIESATALSDIQGCIQKFLQRCKNLVYIKERGGAFESRVRGALEAVLKISSVMLRRARLTQGGGGV